VVEVKFYFGFGGRVLSHTHSHVYMTELMIVRGVSVWGLGSRSVEFWLLCVRGNLVIAQVEHMGTK